MSVILDSGEISRALRRISHEILEKNHGPENLLLLGIPTRGAYLGRRIASAISEIEKTELESGTLQELSFQPAFQVEVLMEKMLSL
jgi:pyrimidine operon attenuation protein/uracil phosphoribosyltransferase